MPRAPGLPSVGADLEKSLMTNTDLGAGECIGDLIVRGWVVAIDGHDRFDYAITERREVIRQVLHPIDAAIFTMKLDWKP